LKLWKPREVDSMEGGSAAHVAAVAGSEGVNVEAIGEKEKPSDDLRQQAEDTFEQTIGLNHWSSPGRAWPCCEGQGVVRP
jgi:hypothetical protein